MNRAQMATALQEVPLFAHCSQRDLRTLLRHLDLHQVEEGTAMVEQGAPGNAFYFLVSGSADVVRNGRRVGALGRGGFFGEMALLDPGPRTASVIATEHCEVLTVSHRMFNVVFRDLPTLRKGLLKSMAGRLRSLDDRLS